MEHCGTYVATEEESRSGDAGSSVWQQCGAGNNSFLPEVIDPDVSLDDITGWLGRRAENATEYRRKRGLDPDDHPTPDPDELYPSRVRAIMPKPMEQVGNSLAVSLTSDEKQALDLLEGRLVPPQGKKPRSTPAPPCAACTPS